MLSRFSCILLFTMLWNIAHKSPLSIVFAKQEYWSGLNAFLQGIFLIQGSNPFLQCLLHRQVASLPLVPAGKPKESHKCVCVSCSVMRNSFQSHDLQPTRLLCPWNFSGNNTGVGSHSLFKGSFQPRNCTHVSCISCIAGKFFYCLNHQRSPLWRFSSVQSLGRVQLFVTPWTAAHQASLSIANSRSPLKLMSIT